MAMNSLFPDGWFALGAAALKVWFSSLIQKEVTQVKLDII